MQVLRGVAAIVVALTHSVRAFTIYRPAASALAYPTLLSAPVLQNIGAIGVDIFFCISGFIMIYVARDTPRQLSGAGDFLVRRWIRIYPPYAVVTAMFCAVYAYYVLRGQPQFELAPARIAASLLFIPSFNQGGAVAPIIDVGWTLFYEMYFYVLFAVAILATRAWKPLFLTLALGAACGLARALGGHGPTALFLQNPIVFEFAFGCILGELFRRGDLARVPVWLPFLAAAVWLCVTPMIPADDVRFLVWGPPSALILAGVLALEARGGVRWGRLPLLLGDASYAIYLVHMLVIYKLVAPLVAHLTRPITIPLATDATILATAAAAIVAGVAVHSFIETPIRLQLMAWYRRGRDAFAIRAASQQARAAG